MSNFITNTKNPKTGEFEPAYWLDDYYGHHHYGVRFKDGTMVDTWKVELETNLEAHDATWDDFPKEPKLKE
jgi:hypothetical protein